MKLHELTYAYVLIEKTVEAQFKGGKGLDKYKGERKKVGTAKEI